MTPAFENMATQKEAQDFLHESMEQLNQLLIGEHLAKRALLANMVLGGNLALVGGTGTGKTILTKEAPYLIDEIARPSEGARNPYVVTFEPMSDLAPHEVTGGDIVNNKTIKTNDEVWSEQVTNHIKGRIDPVQTKVILINEINRNSRDALNTMLEPLEAHTMEVSGQDVKLTGFEFAIANMNPGERQQNTYPVSLATASRFAIGAVLGEDPATIKARREAIFLTGFNPKPVEPVIALSGLHRIRNRVKYGIAMPAEVGREAINIVEDTVDVFHKNRISENGGRVEIHVRDTAMALAALDGDEAVKPEHLREATVMTVAAIVGMLSTKAVTHVSDVTREILY